MAHRYVTSVADDKWRRQYAPSNFSRLVTIAVLQQIFDFGAESLKQTASFRRVCVTWLDCVHNHSFSMWARLAAQITSASRLPDSEKSALPLHDPRRASYWSLLECCKFDAGDVLHALIYNGGLDLAVLAELHVPRTGSRPAHLAAQFGNLKTALLLCKHGISPAVPRAPTANLRSGSNQAEHEMTALDVALITPGSLPVFDVFLEQAAIDDVEVVLRLFRRAVEARHFGVARRLLRGDYKHQRGGGGGEGDMPPLLARLLLKRPEQLRIKPFDRRNGDTSLLPDVLCELALVTPRGSQETADYVGLFDQLLRCAPPRPAPGAVDVYLDVASPKEKQRALEAAQKQVYLPPVKDRPLTPLAHAARVGNVVAVRLLLNEPEAEEPVAAVAAAAEPDSYSSDRGDERAIVIFPKRAAPGASMGQCSDALEGAFVECSDAARAAEVAALLIQRGASPSVELLAAIVGAWRANDEQREQFCTGAPSRQLDPDGAVHRAERARLLKSFELAFSLMQTALGSAAAAVEQCVRARVANVGTVLEAALQAQAAPVLRFLAQHEGMRGFLAGPHRAAMGEVVQTAVLGSLAAAARNSVNPRAAPMHATAVKHTAIETVDALLCGGGGAVACISPMLVARLITGIFCDVVGESTRAVASGPGNAAGLGNTSFFRECLQRIMVAINGMPDVEEKNALRACMRSAHCPSLSSADALFRGSSGSPDLLWRACGAAVSPLSGPTLFAMLFTSWKWEEAVLQPIIRGIGYTAAEIQGRAAELLTAAATAPSLALFQHLIADYKIDIAQLPTAQRGQMLCACAVADRGRRVAIGTTAPALHWDDKVECDPSCVGGRDAVAIARLVLSSFPASAVRAALDAVNDVVGVPPLLLACAAHSPNVDLIDLFLRHGADVNYTEPITGLTPLTAHLVAMIYATQKAARTEAATGRWGEPPAAARSRATVKLLLEAGAQCGVEKRTAIVVPGSLLTSPVLFPSIDTVDVRSCRRIEQWLGNATPAHLSVCAPICCCPENVDAIVAAAAKHSGVTPAQVVEARRHGDGASVLAAACANCDFISRSAQTAICMHLIEAHGASVTWRSADGERSLLDLLEGDKKADRPGCAPTVPNNELISKIRRLIAFDPSTMKKAVAGAGAPPASSGVRTAAVALPVPRSQQGPFTNATVFERDDAAVVQPAPRQTGRDANQQRRKMELDVNDEEDDDEGFAL